jgi:hypothetical protein
VSDLLGVLRKRVDLHARAEVVEYTSTFPEYEKKAVTPQFRAEILDVAVWSRLRTIDLACEDRELTAEDLAHIAEVGEQRARLGFSVRSAQQVLALHAKLMLREIHDATDNDNLTDLLRVAAWVGAQGARGTAAFFEGYLDEQRLRLSTARRLRMLVQLLLAGGPAVAQYAYGLGLRVHGHYLVVVVQVPGFTMRLGDSAYDDVVNTFFREHSVPVMWHGPDQLVALIPTEGGRSPLSIVGEDGRSLSIVRDLVAMIGRPCRVGSAVRPVAALADAFELAQRVAGVGRAEKVPRILPGVADVFVELGVLRMPEIDDTLRELAHCLANGPDLVATLDAYYRNDMNRLGTATALHIHPRTVDYRLQRVRELVEIDPGSVRGVRILATAVARALADT